ncbi:MULTISPECIES: PTS lactose/cellobiose transporter subunit IIA [unclassified Enterococcus]|uniref:PTS lactose/cellobiose transporter subunit IIA n=1 Tax=unclassified Enterococcus TaxID=2608891 RepID=UPI000B642FC9|nr:MULTISPECIES: PTS lactose/cellobiose transporter subunit IIA [unclassified Enterococcus]OTO77370.1 hypothetical protein A5865_001246 [Enterococcus sp. 12E11_DIV0728]OUZ16455.1 hypothetical protein A5868_001376 [Enterococcus sp. 12F9_DIV0723]
MDNEEKKISVDLLEKISFEIISNVGTARSKYINAMQFAKQGWIEKAHASVKEGEEYFVEGHHAHANLLAMQSEGKMIPFSMLLIHCEDQLMSADCFKIMADEFIDLQEKLIKAGVI